jgi:hypothetical protein
LFPNQRIFNRAEETRALNCARRLIRGNAQEIPLQFGGKIWPEGTGDNRALLS